MFGGVRVGRVFVGLDHDTATFAVESIRRWISEELRSIREFPRLAGHPIQLGTHKITTIEDLYRCAAVITTFSLSFWQGGRGGLHASVGRP